MSLADWVVLPEDEPGEIVAGQFVEEEVPDAVHEVIVIYLGQVLRNWLSGKRGVVLGSGAKYALVRSGRKPDLSVFLSSDRVPPRYGLIRIPPDIAVEIVSRSASDARRDRVEKFDEYAAFSVRFYWLVDPGHKTFEIFELAADGRYARAVGAAGGSIAEVPGCPGLMLDVAALWAEVDALPEEEGS